MKQLIKNLLFAALTLLLFCTQLALGRYLPLFGVSFDILPYAVAAIAVYCGKNCGAWQGAWAGLLTDVCSGYGLGIAMPVWFLTGVFGGKWTRKYLRQGFTGVFLFGIAASAVHQLGTALLSVGGVIPMSVLLLTAAKKILYSALLSPIAFLLYRGLDKLLPSQERYEEYHRLPTIRGFTSGDYTGGDL